MNIYIQAIPHDAQRYDTLGDWWFDPTGDHLQIRTSKSGLGEDAEFLVALHELVEAYLCKRRGITTQMVDAWDMHHAGKSGSEPGDRLGCPYGREHRFAMIVEHLMAHELGLGTGYGHVI